MAIPAALQAGARTVSLYHRRLTRLRPMTLKDTQNEMLVCSVANLRRCFSPKPLELANSIAIEPNIQALFA
jgi:hypothetical protein